YGRQRRWSRPLNDCRPVTGPEAARVTLPPPPRQRPRPRPRLLIGRRTPHVTTGTSRF
ncbi:hypothetical protein P7K49_020186, partial [Saguinus oedipus]